MNMNYECYLNRCSLTFFGTMGLLSTQRTSGVVVFLLLSSIRSLRIALISSIISAVCFEEPFVLSFPNHTRSITSSCVSKHVVTIFLMCSLFWPTVIMHSSAFFVLATYFSDWIRIL